MEASQFFYNGNLIDENTLLEQEKRHADPKSSEHFIIEDLLDFSNDDSVVGDDGTFENVTVNSTDSSTVTVIESCESSFSGCNPQFSDNLNCRNFSDELCVPYDDLAELEWVSNFVDESFSSDELQKLQLISGLKIRTDQEVSETREFKPEPDPYNPIIHSEMSVPGKARSKRSRATPCNWSTRLLVLSPTTSSSESDIVSDSGKKTTKATAKKKEVSDHENGNSDGRRCLHCATDKTPQWRTGPSGPKTLCNACGVRFKSGRLVPEYRPASSPTFVVAKHSNSHRKVLELRRQKELQMIQQQPFLYPNPVFDGSGCGEDEYLIHHHSGPDFNHLI